MIIESATVQLDLNVLGTLNAQGALVVTGPSEFKGESIFEKLATFISDVIFKGDVTFLGRPTFNKDTGGFALVKEGEKQIRVSFEKEYSETPVVTANSIWDISEEDLSALTQKEIYLLQKQDFVIAAVTSKGFTILLEESAVVDLKFSWTAIAVKDTKTTISKQSSVLSQAEAGGVTPLPTVTPTATPTSTPNVSEGSQLDSSASPQNDNETTITVSDNELGFLRVRAEPSTSSAEIGQVSPGETYDVLGEQDGWYKIEYEPGKFGWVSGSYVTTN